MTATLTEVANRSFDYVIIGGGTAGLTLASRLTEDPQRSVLVIEAGGANINHPVVLRPGAYGSHFADSQIHWGHKTVKQKYALDTEVFWPRGKGLGGSSAINFLCWVKPQARDVDDIERLGNPGWNWDAFAKYVKRTEGFVDPPEHIKKVHNLNFDSWNIGREGPLVISYPQKIDAPERQITEAIVNAGMPVAKLPMDGDIHGTFLAPTNIDPKTHTRTYATTAHYLPIKDRRNLKVLTDAPVRRVLFNPKADNADITARGVEFEYGGKVYNVYAGKEVLLCAGALKSPQILELSGIGQVGVLNKIGVPTNIELPGVGENIQEHIFAGLSYELKDDVEFDTQDLLRDPILAAQHLELHAKGAGIHTTGIVGFTFATLDDISPNAASIYKSMDDMVNNLDPKTTPPGLIDQYKVVLERFKPGSGSPGFEIVSFPGYLSKPKVPVPGKRYLSFLLALNHSFSRGTIHSINNDSKADPEYDPHTYEKEVDLAVHVELVKFTRKIAATAPLKDLLVGEHSPGPEFQTDEQLAEWLKLSFTTVHHTIGSCSMLPREKGGVVDPSLKVYGTTNLRVVDISVMPLHVAGHTQASAYAIGEQAADIIKGNDAM